jgi:glycine cleavage system H protein
MNIPDGLFYTKEHEWIKIDGVTGTIGITDYAQHALGDVTFVELPKPGRAVIQFKNLASVESVKAASDIFAPMSGDITAPNTLLESQPGLVNSSPYADGWIARIKINKPEEKKNLMDASAYKTFLEGLSH